MKSFKKCVPNQPNLPDLPIQDEEAKFTGGASQHTQSPASIWPSEPNNIRINDKYLNNLMTFIMPQAFLQRI